jgi:hypothetical protein
MTDYRKELEGRDRDNMQKAKEAILEGRMYATVKSVSRSGMSRRIAFYYVENDYIVNCTAQVGWLTGWVDFQEYKQGKRWLNQEGLYVSGCGMDMVFHTLYSALPYEEAKDWKQRWFIL